MMSWRWLSFVSLILFAARIPVISSEKAGSDSLSAYERHLQSCNIILANWTVEELSTSLNSVIDKALGEDSTEGTLAKLTLLNALVYGVQVRRVCASCSDFSSATQPAAFSDFCAGYGADESFSGLLMIPLAEDESFVTGTHPGGIWCHGTSTQSVPSVEFRGSDSGIDLFINAAIASAGAVTLMPDYMGYGESSGRLFKAYLVKQQYQTSIIPLWLKADQIVQQGSNCTAALADAVAILGYSEGGYAAVALAEGLYNMGVEIIKVEAGAGPYRMGSAALLEGQKRNDVGLFPLEVRQYFALVGAAYSSTFPELANFEEGQDMLASDVRQTIVDLVTNSSSADDIRAVIPTDDPSSVFNAQFVTFTRNALQDGDPDPCNNAERVVEGVNDKICEALQDNDLTEILETTPYPVRLCHSPNDTVVSYANLPDFAGNALLELLVSSGDHVEAATTCILQSVLFVLGDDFLGAQVAEKTTDMGCPAVTIDSATPSPSALESPFESSAPSLPLTFATSVPSLSTAPSSSPAAWGSANSISPTIGEMCGDVLASWNATEARSVVTEVYAELFGEDSQEYALFELHADQGFNYGVQVRKVCASCKDFTVASSSYDDYCGQGVYGSSAMHSGLMMLPLSSDGTAIAQGTFPGFVYNHDPSVDQVPSNEWSGGGYTASGIMFGVLPTAAGSITIMPDYLGYGESNGAIFKAFLVKKAYQTSIVPLWLKTAATLENETDCTALADAAMVSGFFEGGYGSIAVADALYNMGIDIIRVHAGAVPARLGSIHLPELVKSIDNETFPLTERFILALFGSAYSATYAGMSNFEEGPYLLNATVQDEIVKVVTEAEDANIVEQAVPMDAPLSIWDQTVLTWARDAITKNETEPCHTTFAEFSFKPLCDTLFENDLTEILESANYSITLCHGRDDKVVSTANLPNATANGNLLISLVDGDHTESYVTCTMQIATFLSSSTYMDYPIVPKRGKSACNVPTDSPASTPSPVAAQSMDASASLRSPTTRFASILSSLSFALVLL